MILDRFLANNIDTKRIYGLDILRAFAISIVVISHSIKYLRPHSQQFISQVSLDGVSIFFVLSGFLIGKILIKTLKTEKIILKELWIFWLRRWFRTLPNYFLILSIVLILYNFPDFEAPSMKRFYFFLQNFNNSHPQFFIEAWSLSVEEWFYILIPAFCFMGTRISGSSNNTILLICIAVILLSTYIRFRHYHSNYPLSYEESELLIRMQVLTRLDSLVYGILGAFLLGKYPTTLMKYKNAIAISGVLFLVINKTIQNNLDIHHVGFYYAVFFLTVNALATVALIPFFNGIKAGKGFIYKAVTMISLISYSMYLINLTLLQDFVIPFINKLIGLIFSNAPYRILDLSLFYLLTIAGALFLFTYVEKPFLHLRDKYWSK